MILDVVKSPLEVLCVPHDRIVHCGKGNQVFFLLTDGEYHIGKFFGLEAKRWTRIWRICLTHPVA